MASRMVLRVPNPPVGSFVTSTKTVTASAAVSLRVFPGTGSHQYKTNNIAVLTHTTQHYCWLTFFLAYHSGTPC